MTRLLLSIVLIASAQGVVVPLSLSQPAYPPIAEAGRVAGEVEVVVYVKPDGSIQSAMVVSGPPLLSGAALAAARSSQFECRGCTETTTTYSIVFSFQLERTADLAVGAQEKTRSVTPSRSRVTVVAEPSIVSGVVYSDTAVRSAKCLWLWKCGFR